ncbi:MAG TPA: peptide deformylase [Candidatus Polarisedimenticolia bacterium]|jgi:peptide deformylase|nr:peptide deformylase [Candidatus Polarisedimenticolia bacterium]
MKASVYNMRFGTEKQLPLTIVQAGEPVLRKAARALRPNEIRSREIRELIQQMKETMYAAPGVGLAAPQIGQGIQLAVIEDRPEYVKDWTPEQLADRERQSVPFHVIINPRITLLGEERIEYFEGCLSLENLMALTPRARSVRVECVDERGEPKVIEASGWYARILQHEIDHLAGTMYVDHMYPRTLMTVENFTRHWKGKTLAELKKDLLAADFADGRR